MKEEIGQILEQLKLKNLSVAKVEKALEFSNGTLGKARDGKINLSAEKMEKLRAYAKVHLETPALDGQIKAMEQENVWKEEVNTLLIEKERWLAERKELDTEIARIKEDIAGLLAKNAALEAENGRLLSEKFINHFVEGQNKPNADPQIEKSGESAKKGGNAKDGAENGPKTLEDVKNLCPLHLRGIDRSVWIAENRKKYNV